MSLQVVSEHCGHLRMGGSGVQGHSPALSSDQGLSPADGLSAPAATANEAHESEAPSGACRCPRASLKWVTLCGPWGFASQAWVGKSWDSAMPVVPSFWPCSGWTVQAVFSAGFQTVPCWGPCKERPRRRAQLRKPLCPELG